MQPAIAIPPYDPAKVNLLVGQKVRVPRLSRSSSKGWWVEIRDVKYVNPMSVLVKVNGSRSFGNSRYVDLSICRWPRHIDDPLAQQIAKARGLRRAA